jgi:hypothetical protein
MHRADKRTYISGTSRANKGVKSRAGLEISKRLKVISYYKDLATEFTTWIANRGVLEYF